MATGARRWMFRIAKVVSVTIAAAAVFVGWRRGEYGDGPGLVVVLALTANAGLTLADVLLAEEGSDR